jgi:hypothetical protein
MPWTVMLTLGNKILLRFSWHKRLRRRRLNFVLSLAGSRLGSFNKSGIQKSKDKSD